MRKLFKLFTLALVIIPIAVLGAGCGNNGKINSQQKGEIINPQQSGQPGSWYFNSPSLEINPESPFPSINKVLPAPVGDDEEPELNKAEFIAEYLESKAVADYIKEFLTRCEEYLDYVNSGEAKAMYVASLIETKNEYLSKCRTEAEEFYDDILDNWETLADQYVADNEEFIQDYLDLCSDTADEFYDDEDYELYYTTAEIKEMKDEYMDDCDEFVRNYLFNLFYEYIFGLEYAERIDAFVDECETKFDTKVDEKWNELMEGFNADTFLADSEVAVREYLNEFINDWVDKNL
jgi:hypothetical protein